ncbi:hypothetical protein NKR74_13370 [Bacillus sp. 3103sda1]|uniref:hypothetical protein n=1 Tax=Bacillus sp. 3103sda1 TaxID=2953808 RepID=UPI00209EA494|nr:hypothetical protein [Bacillus sp. 3103sda1]MCP1124285.1 hypothetical protein [Bacillus sp. 3103sda1]
MGKYFGVISIVVSLIVCCLLTSIDWKLGILGIVVGVILTMKAPMGILKFVSYVIVALCILVFLYLCVMVFLMGGLVDLEDTRNLS